MEISYASLKEAIYCLEPDSDSKLVFALFATAGPCGFLFGRRRCLHDVSGRRNTGTLLRGTEPFRGHIIGNLTIPFINIVQIAGSTHPIGAGRKCISIFCRDVFFTGILTLRIRALFQNLFPLFKVIAFWMNMG